MEEPDAPLERMYIEAFLQKRGYTLHCSGEPLRRICDVPEDEAKRLMTAASAYASTKLAEVETRAHFIEEVHGAAGLAHGGHGGPHGPAVPGAVT